MNSNLAQNRELSQTPVEESLNEKNLSQTISKRSLSVAPELFKAANTDQIQANAVSGTFSFPGREMVILASVLAILQIADGILTGVGVYHMGIDMEANPLLRMLMGIFGTVPTLVAAKGFALLVIALLASLSQIVPWITLAFRGMVALYAFVAVLPWSAILFGYFSV